MTSATQKLFKFRTFFDPDQPDSDRHLSFESLDYVLQYKNHTSTGSRKIRKRNKQSKAKKNQYPEMISKHQSGFRSDSDPFGSNKTSVIG